MKLKTAATAAVFTAFCGLFAAAALYPTAASATVGQHRLTPQENENLSDAIANLTDVSTPAVGSCSVTFNMLNARNVSITGSRTLIMYLSDALGNPSGSATLSPVANGAVVEIVHEKVAMCETTATASLDVTVSPGATATNYLTFILPGGKLLTSTALVSH